MMTKKEDRVPKVIAVVEAILVEIVNEHDSPISTIPAIVEFFSALQIALLRVSHERLTAFVTRKEQLDGVMELERLQRALARLPER